MKRKRDPESQPMLPMPEPSNEWRRPTGKGGCGRDPNAGPGTCYHWYDGCPRPEARGCYILWKAHDVLKNDPAPEDAARAKSWIRNATGEVVP